MSAIKIHGGTPAGGESRCDTCRYASIIRGFAESERIVICGRREEGLRLSFKVAECTDYEDKRHPTLWEMKQIAWEVSPRTATSKTGFVLVSEMTKSDSEAEKAQPEGAPAAATSD